MVTMEADVRLEYIAVGGNRHPSAADWAPGLLAFGAGKNIALWDPQDANHTGTFGLLTGHTDVVNVVKIHPHSSELIIYSGSADKTIRIWESAGDKARPFRELMCLTEHQAAISTIALSPDGRSFASGAADGMMKIWRVEENGAKLRQSIELKPRFIPLALAWTELPDGTELLAVAGTSSNVQLYARERLDLKGQPGMTATPDSHTFQLQATLTGHEGWIRALDFVRHGDYLILASASQDKYIRLWKLTSAQHKPYGVAESTNQVETFIRTSLSNKRHQVGKDGSRYNVTFEALLIGHEDWIYTAKWARTEGSDGDLRLLSASADNSLAIWSADEASGVWFCTARLGEISAQKGSTTATGSTGGFWIGLWQPDATSVVSLGRTGSWRKWDHRSSSDVWEQDVGISGHTQEVQSLAWSPDGSYIMSTSSDQTTRMFGEWVRDGKRSWHEFARPQIHGYDMNCIDSLSANQFISGADEKLLRVFNKPKAVDSLFSKLSGTRATTEGSLADAANIPVLGLSNKAIAAVAGDEPAGIVVNGRGTELEAVDPASVMHKSTLDLKHPPLEDHLARHTLWPELEKLYGHGYEIFAVAASHDGELVATTCKASSLDHAVIRLYETNEWREVKPPLAAHTLTVTSLNFSPDDEYLLSVGRDRQWAIFRRKIDEPCQYELFIAEPKGHSRMILDCAWAPSAAGAIFATAGRDKAVKFWSLKESVAELKATITAAVSVTAIAIWPIVMGQRLRLAYGTEDGRIHIADISQQDFKVLQLQVIPEELCPSGAVKRLRWRPAPTASEYAQIAVASDDYSVRILQIGK